MRRIFGLYGSLRRANPSECIKNYQCQKLFFYRRSSSPLTAISLRFGSTATATIPEVPNRSHVPPLDEVPKPTGITLRPYQHTAINACLTALSSGLTRIGVSSPTGSGKTTMFMNLIPLIRSQGLDEKGRTLIIVGSVELANQAESAAKRLLGKECLVEVEQAKRTSSGRANM